MHAEFEPVIGLEVHAQLLTRTKAFCACPTSFGAPPNTHVCPVCLALPGALPVFNLEVARMAVRTALALGCTVHRRSVFARKNYFYPDLPKGYQISQYEMPLATGGRIFVEAFSPKGDPAVRREVRVERLHIEEDAGKNLHGFGGGSVVDLNRAGTPLVEIVGAPDLRSSEEAAEYLRQLRVLLMFLGVCDGNLEQGSFRCDVNVSVRARGDERLGTRTEVKNVNSFRFAQRAIDHEIARQVAVLVAGGQVEQETRGWDDEAGRTFSQRSKEQAHDYRYFPEPDLPPLLLEDSFVQRERESLPVLPAALRARLVGLGLSTHAASVLTSHPALARLFEATLALHPSPVRVANFVQAEVLRDASFDGLGATMPVGAGQLAGLLRLVEHGAISGKQAKEVYAAIAGTARTADEVVAERGIRQVSDSAAIEQACERVLSRSATQVQAYRAGKRGLLGYFVGQVMKETAGSASPAVVNEILLRLLG
jgi:aspartyl-tRNA(Asn)/glutamyl-tRNA(Gln) amidotransferase subunit B